MQPQPTSSPFEVVVHSAASEPESHLPRASSDNNEGKRTPADDSVLQERTIVGSEDTHGETGDEKRLSLLPNANAPSPNTHNHHGYLDADEIRAEEVSDPLRMPAHNGFEGQELTVVVEDGDITDAAAGGDLYPVSEKKPSPATSRRASHLHLDLKPPSPQPWEIIDPPDRDERKGGQDYYSTLGSHKFDTLQSTTHTRPLIPKSSYYFGPPPSDSAFGTPPVGQIGVHHPREIIRIERDYTGGELVQFAPIYPLELEGRITPTHFLESINAINELLISAHSLRHSFMDNLLAVLTLQLSRLFLTSHYEQQMRKLQSLIDELNVALYNPVGLNILWPRNVAFLYLEIEYY
ncbi:putative golgin subfamily A member 7/ERF4 family protein [Lyophyllum shimeji]|uniref:Ras modification protein ERF4 n=1 Tax=Lyophyllum shimeji TaxID=47721 RepID=A0A9P3UMS2_LYOSH|nr:putative golgin subfamily A member 7/ERF4 family protein [Lyophyllum shimeji]